MNRAADDKSRKPQTDLRRFEAIAALALTAILLSLHLYRMTRAGGLWRDEMGTANLAASFSVRHVVESAQHEIFPMLVPAVLRVCTWVAGDTDTALRAFGMLVGVGIIGAFWLNTLLTRRAVPLLSLALVGFNGLFIQWDDAIRGYGLGTLFIILTVPLVWRFAESPSLWRFGAAAFVALASVQCLFNNAALLLAICVAATVVCLRRRAPRPAAGVLLIGVLCALSLLPYWAPLHAVDDWAMLVRVRNTVADVTATLLSACSASGWWNASLCVLLVVLAVTLSVAFQTRRGLPLGNDSNRDLQLFTGLALALGLLGYVLFLKSSQFAAQVWYFVALLGFIACLLDQAFDILCSQSWARFSRLGLVVFVAGSSTPLAFRQLQERQTNVDLCAARLGHLAEKGDFIIVEPWFCGIPFDRYYHGEADWTTVPHLGRQKLHRYDLVKPFMTLADQTEPIRSTFEQATTALKQGHRVWLLDASLIRAPGGMPPLPPAPNHRSGWLAWPYEVFWASSIGDFLQTNSLHLEPVPIPSDGPVNFYEDFRVSRFDGWKNK